MRDDREWYKLIAACSALSALSSALITLGVYKYTTNHITVISGSDSPSTLAGSIMRYFRKLPGVKGVVEKELGKISTGFASMLPPVSVGPEKRFELPENGVSEEQVMEALKVWGELEDKKASSGRISGAVYAGMNDHGVNESVRRVAGEAVKLFAYSNPLHPGVFPAVRRMEAEVIQMCCSLFGLGAENKPAVGSSKPPLFETSGCGCMTSGGTESILLAMLTYRNWAREAGKVRSGSKPNMVICESAHAAFYKAASYFEIEIRQVTMSVPSMQANVNEMRKAIDRNTMVLVASAPTYAHGIVDDVDQISHLALEFGLPCHVDSCLGSFMLPFVPNIPTYNFSLPGVTSMSIDTHKYGLAPKGSSVLLFRSPLLRKHMYAVFPNWTGGVYATALLSGSRSGAPVAAAWAAMMVAGKTGYSSQSLKIQESVSSIKQSVASNPLYQPKGSAQHKPLYILGDPNASVIAFASDVINIFELLDSMNRQFHWDLNACQFPPCVHICVTPMNVSMMKQFVVDLEVCMKELMARGDGDSDSNANANVDPNGDLQDLQGGKVVKGVTGKQGKKQGDQAAIYGLASSIPDRSLVKELVVSYMDYVLAL